jgi:hypothetical protein
MAGITGKKQEWVNTDVTGGDNIPDAASFWTSDGDLGICR